VETIRALEDDLGRGLAETMMTPETLSKGKETIRLELAALAQGFLSESALLLLTVLTAERQVEPRIWISADEIADEMSKKYRMNRESLAKVLDELRKAGLVVDGVSLKS